MNYKKIIFLTVSLVMTLPAWAQEEAGGNLSSQFDWIIENLVMVIGGAVLLGAIFSLYKAAQNIWRAQTIARYEAEGSSHQAAVKKMQKESFLSYMYTELAGGVPLEQEADVLLNHNYDGIQELDNNLPPWWVGMFYGTIIYAVFYIGIFHFSSYSQSQADEYKQEVREAEIAIAAFNAKQKAEKEAAKNDPNVEEVKLVALTDTDRLAAGQETFVAYCSACHGKLGEGMVGLGQNLTDEYWIHGGGIENVLNTVNNGVPGTTMIPWKTSLNEDQILEVASFVLTLEGTDPPNAREPEGEIWVAEKE